MTFLLGNRLVFNAFWNDEHFTFIQRDLATAKVNIEMTFHNDEDFIGLRVVVPDKFALHLGELEMIVVHLGDDLR